LVGVGSDWWWAPVGGEFRLVVGGLRLVVGSDWWWALANDGLRLVVVFGW